MKFGDKVTNVCAGENNPFRKCYFVKRKTTSRKNGYGIVHKSRFITCTDGKGKFGDFDPEVIFPGWLSKAEADEIWQPIWEKRFGT